MKAPQILTIVLFAMSLGLSLARHGKPKKGKENFWAALIAAAMEIGLLIWGGFFS